MASLNSSRRPTSPSSLESNSRCFPHSVKRILQLKAALSAGLRCERTSRCSMRFTSAWVRSIRSQSCYVCGSFLVSRFRTIGTHCLLFGGDGEDEVLGLVGAASKAPGVVTMNSMVPAAWYWLGEGMKRTMSPLAARGN